MRCHKVIIYIWYINLYGEKENLLRRHVNLESCWVLITFDLFEWFLKEAANILLSNFEALIKFVICF
jgi:hypothetical protein